LGLTQQRATKYDSSEKQTPAKRPPKTLPRQTAREPVTRRSLSPGSPKQSFRALLEPDHTSLKWVIARSPFDIAETWTTMRRLRVRGEINGYPFRTSLFPLPGGQTGHFLLVNRRMQTAAGVTVGAEADILLEPDLEERPAALPPELKAALQGDRKLLRYAEALSESTRREIGKWIAGVESPDARSRRAAQMAERLLLAMEGEHEMPPILEALFVNNLRARSGWHAMTPTQRRSHLLGIFYYQTPEARTRRAGKAVEDALRIARRI